jgi:hypothetical protein
LDIITKPKQHMSSFSLSLGWGPTSHYRFQHNSIAVKVCR